MRGLVHSFGGEDAGLHGRRPLVRTAAVGEREAHARVGRRRIGDLRAGALGGRRLGRVVVTAAGRGREGGREGREHERDACCDCHEATLGLEPEPDKARTRFELVYEALQASA